MLLGLAVLLVLAWVFVFFVFKVTMVGVHLLLIVALIAIIYHFLRGSRTV